MKVECVSFFIDRRSAEICDSFFINSSLQYKEFMDTVSKVSKNSETAYDLENAFIRQAREAIDYAYRTAISDILSNLDDNDDILTTRTLKNPQLSHD